jgi:hypothetical protein
MLEESVNSLTFMGTVQGQAGFCFPPEKGMGWAMSKYASKLLKQILVILVEYLG